MQRKHGIATGALAVALLLGGGYYFMLPVENEADGSAPTLRSPEISEADESIITTLDSSEAGNVAEEERSSRPLWPDVDAKRIRSMPISEALEDRTPLVEAINEMALRGQWSYDDKAKNLAIWESLCSARDDSLSSLIDEEGSPSGNSATFDSLCKDFSSVQQEVDDFIRLEIDERARGVNERARLEESLDKAGPDDATVIAVSELSRALRSFDYARVLEIVWFLGVYDFSGSSSEYSLYSRNPSVPTMFAVSASIFCTYIGGCGTEHPVSLNLCLQFPERPCSRYPVDIYDAVDQVLTGAEVETFNTMQNSLVRLLNRYHQGDL